MRHLPNIICALRILLVWPIAAELEQGHYLLALALFVVAGLSDGLDGFLAKHFDWQSELGKFLDPLADKMLLVTVYVESAWLGLAPWWVTAAVVARDVDIALGALAFRLWFGPLHGRPTVSSKLNTLAQLLFVVMLLLHLGVKLPPAEVLQALAVAVVVTSAISGFNYMAIFTRRALEAAAAHP